MLHSSGIENSKMVISVSSFKRQKCKLKYFAFFHEILILCGNVAQGSEIWRNKLFIFVRLKIIQKKCSIYAWVVHKTISISYKQTLSKVNECSWLLFFFFLLLHTKCFLILQFYFTVIHFLISPCIHSFLLFYEPTTSSVVMNTNNSLGCVTTDDNPCSLNNKRPD